jgi:hypothetical protein
VVVVAALERWNMSHFCLMMMAMCGVTSYDGTTTTLVASYFFSACSEPEDKPDD